MHDEDAFRRAIAERPHDNGLKLVFADWLEERGDPLAETVRKEATEGAFRQAIEQSPKDSKRFLDFADWLEQQGDQVRADFYRRRAYPPPAPLPHFPGTLAEEPNRPPTVKGVICGAILCLVFVGFVVGGCLIPYFLLEMLGAKGSIVFLCILVVIYFVPLRTRHDPRLH